VVGCDVDFSICRDRSTANFDVRIVPGGDPRSFLILWRCPTDRRAWSTATFSQSCASACASPCLYADTQQQNNELLNVRSPRRVAASARCQHSHLILVSVYEHSCSRALLGPFADVSSKVPL